MTTKDTFISNFTCKCGKPSVEADTWFNYYPCKDHKHMSPMVYSRMETKEITNDYAG